jgi:hypothetical protein
LVNAAFIACIRPAAYSRRAGQIGTAEEVLDARTSCNDPVAKIRNAGKDKPAKADFDRSGSAPHSGDGNTDDRAWRTGVLIGFGAGIVQILAGGPPRRRSPVIEPRLAPLSP